MELQTITEEPEVAKRLFEEYRTEIRKPLRDEATAAQLELRRLDTEMARAWKQLADGTTLLRLAETIRAGGLMQRAAWGDFTCALPKLAVARADARHVYTIGVTSRGNITFSVAKTPNWRQLSEARQNIVEIDEAFEEDAGKERYTSNGTIWSALVPTVPPRYRPNRLAGYHVLFEVENWQREPQPPGRDPALLKHIGGDLWAVVATWDLTPLEAAVLGQQ
jgi:hypothetical protein